MDKSEKHHFVSEVYLKEFANSQKQFHVLKKTISKIKTHTVAQVCYEHDYFRLKSQDSLILHKLDDANYIEKNVFKKHENKYPKLVRKLVYPSVASVFVPKSEILLFLEILLTIKKRNPKFRQQLIDDHKRYVMSDEFKKDMEVGIEISRRVDKINPEDFIENFIQEVLTDENRQSDMYLRSFLTEQDATAFAVDLLLRRNINVYHAPFGSEFITSDNPGFVVLPNDDILSYGGFGLAFKFIFPITPKCCLLMQHDDMDDDYLLKKKIHVLHANKATVY